MADTDETRGDADALAFRLSRAAIAGQVLYTGGWVVAALVQDPGYLSARHNIGDLGALTARAPWLLLVPQGIAGILTILFALLALRPALHVPGRREPLGAWLVALSLAGLHHVSDVFFRLDCMAATPGCDPSVATASWGGTVHVAIEIGTVLLTLAAPLALAGRMRLAPGWQDLEFGARTLGVVLTVLVVLYIGLDGLWGQGYVRRAIAPLVAGGVVVLAHRVAERARVP